MPLPEPSPIMSSPLVQPMPGPIAVAPPAAAVGNPANNNNAPPPGVVNTLFGPRPDPNAQQQQPGANAPMLGPGGVAPVSITPLGGPTPSPLGLPAGSPGAPNVSTAPSIGVPNVGAPTVGAPTVGAPLPR
jgi:hypothetical protein